jgi:single-strand DNA-binding protein
MASLNKVCLIGNVGRALELRHTAKDEPVTNFSLATDKEGEDASKVPSAPEWHRIVVYGSLAENAVSRFRKGDVLYIEGSLSTSKRRDDQQIEHYTTEIVAKEIKLVCRTGGTRRIASDASDQGRSGQ